MARQLILLSFNHFTTYLSKLQYIIIAQFWLCGQRGKARAECTARLELWTAPTQVWNGPGPAECVVDPNCHIIWYVHERAILTNKCNDYNSRNNEDCVVNSLLHRTFGVAEIDHGARSAKWSTKEVDSLAEMVGRSALWDGPCRKITFSLFIFLIYNN